ncbi:hypothetical protein [Thiocystis violacea]|uniref:hypothetical protein n=1 Tax=Thiocystis violacea TaxID=13725 RepID=UPI001905586F|nr:hypothetical protein [Thiocystis violacea]MBK1723388.1 hypothetical protein [Thiocystis violacea]
MQRRELLEIVKAQRERACRATSFTTGQRELSFLASGELQWRLLAEQRRTGGSLADVIRKAIMRGLDLPPVQVDLPD